MCTCSEEYGSAGDDTWGKIPEPEDLSARLGALGLDKNKQIITLGHTLKGWGEDARIAWELRAAGYENVRIVNGGIDALFDAGAEKQSAASDPVPCEVTVDDLDKTHVMETSELAANFDQYKIVDVRTDDEYNGATKYGEAKGGHIKGAVFVPYLDLFQKDGTLKTNDEITAMFEAQGVNKTDRVVAYCTGGIRSAYVQMVLEMCGYETTFNYDQSYWNWCVDNEVE
jgi:thiosulfate/3-mercaptopyruvate sulfurtransferase